MNVCVPNIMAHLPIIQSGSKWWTDQQTDIAVPRAALLAQLKAEAMILLLL